MGLIRPRIAETKPETVSRLLLKMIRATADLQRREHLAFLFSINQAVLVLHRDEWREVMGDCVVCETALSSMRDRNVCKESQQRTLHLVNLKPFDNRVMHCSMLREVLYAHIDRRSKSSCRCTWHNPPAQRREELSSIQS